MEAAIREKLQAALQPGSLVIRNVSHHHAGHAGSPNSGHSHFEVEIVADAFEGLSRVARHRRVYSLLAAEMAGPVHALALVTEAPSELAARDAGKNPPASPAAPDAG